MTPTSFDQIDKVRAEYKDIIIVYSLAECPPCVLLKNALLDVLERRAEQPYVVFECPVDRNDKMSLGKLFLAGIDSFPSLQVQRSGVLTGDYAGVPQDWTHADAVTFLDDALYGDAAVSSR